MSRGLITMAQTNQTGWNLFFRIREKQNQKNWGKCLTSTIIPHKKKKKKEQEQNISLYCILFNLFWSNVTISYASLAEKIREQLGSGQYEEATETWTQVEGVISLYSNNVVSDIDLFSKKKMLILGPWELVSFNHIK